jgi:hypothetical protein
MAERVFFTLKYRISIDEKSERFQARYLVCNIERATSSQYHEKGKLAYVDHAIYIYIYIYINHRKWNCKTLHRLKYAWTDNYMGINGRETLRWFFRVVLRFTGPHPSPSLSCYLPPVINFRGFRENPIYSGCKGAIVRGLTSITSAPPCV